MLGHGLDLEHVGGTATGIVIGKVRSWDPPSRDPLASVPLIVPRGKGQAEGTRSGKMGVFDRA